MKLEDIKLQLGDKITHENGIVEYYNNQILGWKETIVKIERYVFYRMTLPTDELAETYILKTIWERKEILDKEEKDYLSKVIEPFRDRVRYIRKAKLNDYNLNIVIGMDETGFFALPNFTEKTRYYKGMELNKEYSLEELGL